MAMSTRQLVEFLQGQGHQVTYHIRKDGGLLITSIDGTKYKGATGNKVARWMAGEQLSERRAQQLKTITTHRKVKRKKTSPLTPVTLEKTRQRVMRKWRKANLRGSISKRNLRQMIEDRGIEGAETYLEEMERRTEGLAYKASVEGLISRIEQDIVSADEEDGEWLQKLIDLIKSKEDVFKETWLLEIVRKLYDWEEDKTGSVKAHDVYIYAESLIGS